MIDPDSTICQIWTLQLEYQMKDNLKEIHLSSPMWRFIPKLGESILVNFSRVMLSLSDLYKSPPAPPLSHQTQYSDRHCSDKLWRAFRQIQIYGRQYKTLIQGLVYTKNAIASNKKQKRKPDKRRKWVKIN